MSAIRRSSSAGDQSLASIRAKIEASQPSSKQDVEAEVKIQDNVPYTPNPAHLEGVADMSQLIYLETENVVHNLEVRYTRKDIYTSVQSILIAVNPYDVFDIYSEETMNQYRNAKRAQLAKLPPHCFSVAEEAYQLLARTHVNQSMVICGESGSGKTESAKVFMRYLAHITGHEKKVAENGGSIEERFLQVNPILEALGNAQTNMNNNSSRFAKFTQVLFERNGAPPSSLSGAERVKAMSFRPPIAGSFVETYLLEKSRVIHQEKGERNYHIFYQIIAGASPELRQEFGLEMPSGATEDPEEPGVPIMEKFYYMNQSGCYSIDGVSDASNLKRFQNALSALSFTSQDQRNLLALLAGILHLGNVTFNPKTADECVIIDASKPALAFAARLFGVDEERLLVRLTTRNIKVGANVIPKPLSADDATNNRDTIAKTLYHGLFLNVIRRINNQLYPQQNESSKPLWIGILDVFGFECSEFNNSFEQFCINFANERLQQYFNENVVRAEQEEYLREALPWTPVEVKDNTDTIKLIEEKPSGILAVLDSACIMPKGSDEVFIQNLFEAQRRHPRLKQARARESSSHAPASNKGVVGKKGKEKFSGFILDHYAGKVCYNAEGFLEKNVDSVNLDNVELFGKSTNNIVSDVMAPPVEENKGANHKRRQSTYSFNSVGSNFQKQLGELMTTLSGTSPHFVRCINPNQFKTAGMFDRDYVRPQLILGGLLEALRILKLGYPSRIGYDQIFQRYGHTIPKLAKRGDSVTVQKEFAEAVFLAFGLETEAYKLGLTKVYFRPGKQEWLENVLGANPELPPEMIIKVSKLMFGKRIARLKAGVTTIVRFQNLLKQMRVFRRISSFAAITTIIARAVATPVKNVKRARAAVALQAAFRVVLTQKQARKEKQAIVAIQKHSRRYMRRISLEKELKERVARTRQQKATASNVIMRFHRHTRLRQNLRAELQRRVEATRKRKDESARLAQEKREAEERERKRLLEEARKRAEEEERKQREEEARLLVLEEKRRKEEEERLKKEEDDRKRADLERREKDRVEREERVKADAALKVKLAEEERLAEEKRIKDAEEEARRLEEERAKSLAMKRAQELKQKEKDEAEKKKREQEEKERQIREQQEQAERERMLLEKIEDRRMEELDDVSANEREISVSITESKLEHYQKEAVASATTTPTVMVTRSDSNKVLGGSSSMDSIKEPDDKKKRYAIPSHILAAHMAEKKRQSEERADEQARRMRHILLTGGKFLKYGNRGDPHIKHICMNVLGNLHWDAATMDPRKLLPSSTYIKLKNVLHVIPGKETPIFKRRVARRAPDYLCFSIISTERTLDLQAVNVKERDLWIKAIQSAVQDVRTGMVDMITGEKAQTASNAAAAKAKLVRRHTLQPRQAQQMQQELAAQESGLSMGSFRSEEELMRFVMQGGEFLRFESKGKPQIVFVDCNSEKLFVGAQPQPSTREGHQQIILREVESVRAGKVTGVFQYRSTDALSPPENCFSLIFKAFTLDLQVETTEMRNSWVTALNYLMEKAKRRHLNQQEAKNGAPARKQHTRAQSLRLPSRGNDRTAKSPPKLPESWVINENENEEENHRAQEEEPGTSS